MFITMAWLKSSHIFSVNKNMYAEFKICVHDVFQDLLQSTLGYEYANLCVQSEEKYKK